MRIPADWGTTLGREFRGRVRFLRRFGRPTGLGPGDRLELVLQQVDAWGTVTLNGLPLGPLPAGPGPHRFDVSALLQTRKADPVTGMREYGTYHQPKGTWSDDSSLLICTAESLLNGFDLHDMGSRFVRWYREGYWTPWGETFDVGNTTQRAIRRLEQGADPETAGDNEEEHNGNGSLMRTAPIGVRFARDARARVEAALRDSAVTHFDPRCQLACVALDGAIAAAVTRRPGEPLLLIEAAIDEVVRAAARMARSRTVPAAERRAAVDAILEDLNLALASARSLGVSLPNTATAQELFNACVAHGGAKWDHSAMVRALEKLANHEVAK